MRSLKSGGSALAVFAIAFFANASNAWADFVTFTQTNGSLSASATFEVSGGNLIVTLTNTSTSDVTVPSQLLTAVFFSLPGSLTPVSATVNSGSSVTNNTSDGDDAFPDVSGEWAYTSGLSMSWGSNSGISSAGFGIFGSNDTFSDLDLDDPDAPNGMNYGITSAGDNPATGNGGISDEPIIQNSVVFTLSGWNEDWSLSDIMYVVFQYGTSLSEPQLGVPEPGVLALLGVGLVGLAFAFRKYSWA